MNQKISYDEVMSTMSLYIVNRNSSFGTSLIESLKSMWTEIWPLFSLNKMMLDNQVGHFSSQIK